MGIEIERKFLVKDRSWQADADGLPFCQGYLNAEKGQTVRVRTAGNTGYLTIKGPTMGSTRLEYEYQIPLTDAREMLFRLCHQPLIEKTRYIVKYQGFTWEIDVFHGANEGLVVAEIELEQEDQNFPLPPWAGEEVTGQRRYYNSSLGRNPFSTWSDRDHDR